MSRLDYRLRFSRDPEAIAYCESLAEEYALPDQPSDADSYAAGLRAEDRDGYWMEAGR